jgi:hypothetical protein
MPSRTGPGERKADRYACGAFFPPANALEHYAPDGGRTYPILQLTARAGAA